MNTLTIARTASLRKIARTQAAWLRAPRNARRAAARHAYRVAPASVPRDWQHYWQRMNASGGIRL